MQGSVPSAGKAAAELPPPSPLDTPDLANRRAGWKKYPMIMRHPAEKPAVVSNDRQVGADGREVWVNAPPGQPIKFGPVTVLNEHQEELHKSKGYVGAGDAKAIERHERAPIPPGYVYEEYPRILPDGSIDQGPDAPAPPDNFYPYWVRMDGWPDELVEDREAHQALLKKRGVEEPPPPAPVVDERDTRIADLEAKLAEMKDLVTMLVRRVAGQPAQVPPADAVAAGNAAAPAELPGQAEGAPADLEVNTAAEVDPNGPAIVTAIGEAQLAAEPSAEDVIKARIAELDAEEAALGPDDRAELDAELEEANKPAEPAKGRKR